MYMPIGNISSVVSEYFESAILPAASRAGGIAPFAAGLVSGIVARRAPEVIQQYIPALRALGIVNAENQVNIDLLYQEACKSLDKNPIIIAGYKPNRDDLDRLKMIMEKHGV